MAFSIGIGFGHNRYCGGGFHHRNYIGGSVLISNYGGYSHHHSNDDDDEFNEKQFPEEGHDHSRNEYEHLGFMVERCQSRSTHHMFHPNFPKVHELETVKAINYAFQSAHGNPAKLAEFKRTWLYFDRYPIGPQRDKMIEDAMDNLTIKFGGKVTEEQKPEQEQKQGQGQGFFDDDESKETRNVKKPAPAPTPAPKTIKNPLEAGKDILTQSKEMFKTDNDADKTMSTIINDMRIAGLTAEEVQPLREKFRDANYNHEMLAVVGRDILQYKENRNEMNLHEALEKLNEALLTDVTNPPSGSNIPNYREISAKISALK